MVIYGYMALCLYGYLAGYLQQMVWLYIATALSYQFIMYVVPTLLILANPYSSLVILVVRVTVGNCSMSDVSVTRVMAGSSIQIDTITCNAAVSACEKGGEWPHALDILQP